MLNTNCVFSTVSFLTFAFCVGNTVIVLKMGGRVIMIMTIMIYEYDPLLGCDIYLQSHSDLWGAQT